MRDANRSDGFEPRPGHFPILAAQCLNLGIPLGGGSERMPAAFFRISRCSVSRRTSRRKRCTSACSASLLSGRALPLIQLKYADPEFACCLLGRLPTVEPLADRKLLERVVILPRCDHGIFPLRYG